MIRRSLLLAALAAPFAGAGCSTANMRVTTDRVNFAPVTKESLGGAECRSPLRACHMNAVVAGFNESVNKARERHLQQVFSGVVRQAVPNPFSCEVGVKFPNLWNDQLEAYDSSNRFLAHFEVPAVNLSVKALCLATKAGGLLAAKLPSAPAVAAAAAPAPASAPAAAGLTKEDVAAAVAAAMKAQQAPAAAPAADAPLNTPGYSSPERPDDLAVIVGVESYSDIATKAPYAERDAAAFKAHARALGVPERNIVLLTGSKAVKSALEKNVEGWLPRLAKPDSRVYFYFSGHGAPDVKTGRAYLVPWDGDPNFLDATAYPVARLYEKLSQLPAKQVLVALDSCFSGAGGRSVLASGARPLVNKVDTGSVPAKLTVLAASASDEISGSLDDKRAGAFTWFLLEGLNAGKRSAKELHAYLTPKVQDEARRLNRDQTPQLLGADASLR